jgi:hypothetical protein
MNNHHVSADALYRERERKQQQAQDSLCDDLESILKLSVAPDPLRLPGDNQLFQPPGL